MKKSFRDVPSPLFTFVNGEEDADDGDVEDHPFSAFLEWILFGTEEKEDEKKDVIVTSESEFIHMDGSESAAASVQKEELENSWQSLRKNDVVRRALYEGNLQRPEELLVHRKLMASLLRLDGKPAGHTVGSD